MMYFFFSFVKFQGQDGRVNFVVSHTIVMATTETEHVGASVVAPYRQILILLLSLQSTVDENDLLRSILKN